MDWLRHNFYLALIAGMLGQPIGLMMIGMRYSEYSIRSILPGIIVFGVATLLLVWGCRHYAMGGGYAGAWGWLGALNLAGMLILLIVLNKNRTNDQRGFEVTAIQADDGSRHPRPHSSPRDT